METYIPPFKITPAILAAATDIGYCALVKGPPKDILEVKNAVAAYDLLKTFNIHSLKDFLKAHKILMAGLIPDAGSFRKKGVDIVRNDGITHIAPPAGLVPTHMDNLFSFLKNQHLYHPLVKASVFHYELEFIHPFSDGNGRMGRLWEHALLIDWHPVFELISIEAMVKQEQQAYYKALEISDQKGSCEDFIEFNLSVILKSFRVFFQHYKPQPLSAGDRLQTASEKLKGRQFSRKDYMQLFPTISTCPWFFLLFGLI